jgi:hypothetical protein
MLTLKESMELAGQNLLATLSPAYGYLPFWRINLTSDRRAECPMFWPSHNVGRWWDALLRLEAATGFSIPAWAEEPMLTNLRRCLDNPLAIWGHVIPRIAIEPDGDPIGWFDDGSQREGLLALTALVRYRGLGWAGELGGRMVRALDSYILENGDWEWARMGDIVRKAGVPLSQPVLDFYSTLKGFITICNHGRLIEPLLEFYLATQDEAALELAERLAKIHFDISTRPDGSTPPAEHIHTHSLFGTYLGLLLYGQLTRQHEYIDRVVSSYQATVRKHVRQSGFISHDLGKENDGETAAPGDAAQLALGLSRSGYAEFLDDAERLVRARILPSQITAPIGLKPLIDDGKDEHARLDERALGAFGGMPSQTHSSKNPTTDITAADLHTLCDIYTHIVEITPLGLQINFHFDYEDERIRIRSTRGETAHLDIRLKVTQPLNIRVPAWAPTDSVHITVNAQPLEPVWTGHFIHIPKQAMPARIQVDYGLPVTSNDETTDGVTYHFTWRGDDITAMMPNSDWLPFYPAG